MPSTESRCSLTPTERDDGQWASHQGYLDDLPTAGADADQALRNQLAGVSYQEVWVNGPRVEYAWPQPEVEPLFQERDGASQPVSHVGHDEAPRHEGLSHSMMAEATPMGIGTHTCHHHCLVIPVQPCAGGNSRRLTASSRLGLPPELWTTVAARATAGESLRALGRE
jgi:hypothetical protein